MRFFKERKKVRGAAAGAAPEGNEQTNQILRLAEIAIETWRIKDRLRRLQASAKVEDPAIGFSIEKIQKVLSEVGVEIKDPTGEPYREGLVLDVLTFDWASNESPTNRIIQETVSPAIYYHGKLVKMAKVIVGRGGG